jgi:hypothetical protein
MSFFRHRQDIPAAILVFGVFAIQLWAFFSISNPWQLAGYCLSAHGGASVLWRGVPQPSSRQYFYAGVGQSID